VALCTPRSSVPPLCPARPQRRHVSGPRERCDDRAVRVRRLQGRRRRAAAPGVAAAEAGAFSGSGLTRFHFPPTLKEIFCECESLAEVTFSPKTAIVHIPTGTFAGPGSSHSRFPRPSSSCMGVPSRRHGCWRRSTLPPAPSAGTYEMTSSGSGGDAGRAPGQARAAASELFRVRGFSAFHWDAHVLWDRAGAQVFFTVRSLEVRSRSRIRWSTSGAGRSPGRGWS
jgi:hypothetical protein